MTNETMDICRTCEYHYNAHDSLGPLRRLFTARNPIDDRCTDPEFVQPTGESIECRVAVKECHGPYRPLPCAK